MARISRPNINVISYPYVLLEHDTYRVDAQGLGVIEAYGYTFEDIEKRFSKTQSMKYTRETDADYTLHISFEGPSVKNEGIKKETKSSRAIFFGAGSCNAPVTMKLTNRDGWDIIEEFYVFQSTPLKGSSFSTEAEAKKHWKEYLKNEREIIVKSTVLDAINTAFEDFKSKHDYYIPNTNSFSGKLV